MSYKIITTVLLVIVASLLLVNLAFKVKVDSTSIRLTEGQATAKGCCAKGGGGCGSSGENKIKGETK